MNLWSYPLSNDIIESIASCGEDREGNIISWSREDWTLLGEVEMKEMDLRSLCNKKEMHNLVFPEQIVIGDAEYRCSIVGGQLPTPTNDIHNQEVFASARKFMDFCGSRPSFWLGMNDIGEENVWRSIYTDISHTYLPFADNQPDGGTSENCLILDLIKGGWSDWSCRESNKFCSACVFPSQILYTIRGICESEAYNTKFILHGYRKNRPYWRGYYKHQIDFYENTWRLRDMWSNKTVAHLEVREVTKYPFGINTWTVLVSKS